MKFRGGAIGSACEIFSIGPKIVRDTSAGDSDCVGVRGVASSGLHRCPFSGLGVCVDTGCARCRCSRCGMRWSAWRCCGSAESPTGGARVCTSDCTYWWCGNIFGLERFDPAANQIVFGNCRGVELETLYRVHGNGLAASRYRWPEAVCTGCLFAWWSRHVYNTIKSGQGEGSTCPRL